MLYLLFLCASNVRHTPHGHLRTPPTHTPTQNPTNSTRAITEVEPQLTLRGHSAAITRLIISPSKQLLYSASLDSTVRVWALPPPSHTTYAPFDVSRLRGELIGHTDAVWDLALVRDESTLISCGAEGSVKVWDVGKAGGREGARLKVGWMYGGLKEERSSAEEGGEGDGEGEEKGEGEQDGDVEKDEGDEVPGATSVEAIKVDLKKVAVAYTNGVIKIFDIEDGRELMRLSGGASDGMLPFLVSNCLGEYMLIDLADEASWGQANSIVSHPTMPILITAHEDKHIRMFDIITGTYLLSVSIPIPSLPY